MTIRVLYFASLREQVGEAVRLIDASSAGLNAAALWSRLNPAMAMPANTLIAINQNYASLETPIADGDEVAFFPPVTGG